MIEQPAPAVFEINSFFNDLPIRIIGTAENPFFYANDLAAVLGIKNVRTSTKGFDETEIVTPEEREKYDLVTYQKYKNVERPNDKVILLTESGVYRLINGSRLDIVRPFKIHINNIIKNARLAETTKLKTLTDNKEKLSDDRYNKVHTVLLEYEKHSPAMFVFRREINDNPYKYIHPHEIDKELVDKDLVSEYIYKYTLQPEALDYTCFTLYCKVYGHGKTILDELSAANDRLEVNRRAGLYCAYSESDETDSIESPNSIVWC